MQIYDKNGTLLKVPDGTDVYAKWTPEVYQVSFRNNQNTNVQNEEHSYQEVFSPNLPENFYLVEDKHGNLWIVGKSIR